MGSGIRPRTAPHPSHHERLLAIARATPWFMQALVHVRALCLPEWCVGAGAVRNLVWDALHAHAAPSALADVDVAFFDAADPTPARDAALQATLQAAAPGTPWEVTNQAGVHLWFERHFGHPVAPLRSLEEAVERVAAKRYAQRWPRVQVVER